MNKPFYVSRWLNIPAGAGLRVLIIESGVEHPKGEAIFNDYYRKFGAEKYYSKIEDALKAAVAIRNAWEEDLRSVLLDYIKAPQIFALRCKKEDQENDPTDQI